MRTGIDALRFDDVMRESGVGTAGADAGSIRTLDIGRIGQFEVTEVHHGGICRSIGRICIIKSARGISFAEKQIRHAFGAVCSRQTYIHYGVYTVIRLKFVQLHSGNGIDEHDDLVRILFGKFKQVTLVLRKRQCVACADSVGHAAALAFSAGLIVRALGVGSAEDDYSSIVVCSEIGRAQHGHGHLERIVFEIIGFVACPAGGHESVLARPCRICFLKCGIDVNPGSF